MWVFFKHYQLYLPHLSRTLTVILPQLFKHNAVNFLTSNCDSFFNSSLIAGVSLLILASTVCGFNCFSICIKLWLLKSFNIILLPHSIVRLPQKFEHLQHSSPLLIVCWHPFASSLIGWASSLLLLHHTSSTLCDSFFR